MVVGYLRPEADFTTLEALARTAPYLRSCARLWLAAAEERARSAPLNDMMMPCVAYLPHFLQIAQIKADAVMTEKALDGHPDYAALRSDAFLVTLPAVSS